MKLSHLLIATLVSSSVIVSAQTDVKGKSKSKTKAKAKTEKKAKVTKVCIAPSDSVSSVKTNEHICYACGRG